MGVSLSKGYLQFDLIRFPQPSVRKVVDWEVCLDEEFDRIAENYRRNNKRLKRKNKALKYEDREVDPKNNYR